MADFGALLQSIFGIPNATTQPAAPPQPQKMGKGQLIAGILGDALSGAMGRQGQFAPMMMRQREAEREDANWGRRLEQKEQIEAKYRKPDVAPMERDLAVWMRMSPEQRAAYQQMQTVMHPEPDVTITLPNGQIFSGPRSRLDDALRGATAPKPVGKLTPIDGGPVPQAPGGFPRSY